MQYGHMDYEGFPKGFVTFKNPMEPSDEWVTIKLKKIYFIFLADEVQKAIEEYVTHLTDNDNPQSTFTNLKIDWYGKELRYYPHL